MLTLIFTSCQEPDYCDVLNHQYPASLLINLLDQTTNENLLFGNNRSLSIDEIDVQIKREDSTYVFGYIEKVLNNEDSVLGIILREISYSLDFPFLTNEIIINYNNQFPADTM